VTRRLVAGYVLLTLVVLVVLMLPLGITHQHDLQQDLLLRMERDAGVVASLVQDDLRDPTVANQRSAARMAEGYARETGARVAITGPAGVVVYDTDPAISGARSLASRPEIHTALEGTVATGSRYSETLATDLLYVAVPVAASGKVYGAVRVTYPTSEILHRARDYWLLLLGVAVITLAAVAIIGWLIARWVARPLAMLEKKAKAVGEGDLTARASENDGPPEVRALAHRFNVMVTQVEALVGAQEAFVADASHQLRTPLTAMRLRIENLGAGAGPAGEIDADAAIAEVDRLSRMVDSLLALARAERRETAVSMVNVSEMVRDRADAWTELAAESGVTIDSDVAPGLRVLMSDGVLEQVIDNLLDNAVTASPDGGHVMVGASVSDSSVQIVITDQGPGMPPDERQHAFDRFWRSQRSTPGEGSGLGLAIVHRLVTGAGGEVWLQPAPTGTGLRAVVDLPRG